MASNAQLKEAFGKLFAQMAIPETEVNDRFQKAVDSGYWRTLCPCMGLMNRQNTDDIEGTALPLDEETRALAHLARFGYFQLPAVAGPAVIARMRNSVEALRNAGWPAVFSYVYDEFWAILRTPSMVRFLSRQLGTGYLQTAPVWTHHVDPRTRTSGWWPHTDGDIWKNTERLTVWIPLTDASIGNGCMYVIAQDCMPPSLPDKFSSWTSVSRNELIELLHNVTPLPAARGSVLGWNFRLIHWGGRAMDPTSGPRMSVAVEFLQEGAKPSWWELPVFDERLPNFAARLRVISQAILDYGKFEPLMHRYFDLACKLIHWSTSDLPIEERNIEIRRWVERSKISVD